MLEHLSDFLVCINLLVSPYITLQTWLQQQSALSQNNSVFATLAALKHRFTRAVSIYQPSHSPLKDTVHDWAKVLFREILETESNQADTLWHLLERARIGLMGLTIKLPEEWDKTLGEALWNALRKTIDDIGGGYVPAENEPCLSTRTQQPCPFIHAWHILSRQPYP